MKAGLMRGGGASGGQMLKKMRDAKHDELDHPPEGSPTIDMNVTAEEQNRTISDLWDLLKTHDDEKIFETAFKLTGEKEDIGCINSELFAPHLTPLMLACIKNHFELVLRLLNRGHELKIPHRADCKCKDCCEERKHGENVESQIRRVDTFRAMSSSAYLWLSTDDPILFAVKLSTELDKCANVEKQFMDVYKKINERVRKFARGVAQQCQKESEAHLLLKRKDGMPVGSANFPIPRLRLALDSKMKDLCSELSVQSEIGLAFFGEWADWTVSSPAKNFFLRLLPHTLGYPFCALIFLFSSGRLIKSFNYPFARYLSYFSSYIGFLICMWYLVQDTDETNIRGFSRKPKKLALGIYTWLYIFGMFWMDFLTFSRIGARRFFAVWWNWFDIVQSSFFAFAFFTFIRSELEAGTDGLRYMERKNWVWWDSQLVAEGVYGAATVIAFWRIFYFLQLLRGIGPTIISIGRCISDIFQYLLIMGAVVCAYSGGVKYIYVGYSGYFFNDPKTGDVTHQVDHFVSWPETLRFLYWSFYGYLPPSEQRIITGDLGLGKQPMEHGHWLNETVAEILLAFFHIVCIIVLLNLMIAMICTSASSILENEDIEWKFVRCHLWAEFFEDANSLPPPFNFFHWIVDNLAFAICGKEKRKFKWPDLLYCEPESDEKEKKEYFDLLKTLFDRYLTAEMRCWKTASELHQEECVKSVRLVLAPTAPDTMNVTKM